jgi:4-diphosphocytidyl-2-C-methyl-D-erythritol kinase
MDKINLKVPAKINLFLRVLDKRPDGYHNLESLMQAIDLYDDLTLEKSNEIELDCPDLPDLPPEKNLAYRAAKLVEELAYFPGVRITLRKQIPSGAGLGGGSADAAYVIRGLIQLFGLKLNPAELWPKVAKLGADVAFFFSTGQAAVGGIGDIIRNCQIPLNYNVLLVKPPYSVDTSKAYAELDKLRGRKISLTKGPHDISLYRSITDHNFVRLSKAFINDLEEVVFSWHPGLDQVKNGLLDDGAFYSGLTGSGSAIFGLFAPSKDTTTAIRRFIDTKNNFFVCKPVLLPPVYESTA